MEVNVDYDRGLWSDTPSCWERVFLERVKALRHNEHVKHIRICETGKGYHVYIEVDDKLLFDDEVAMRAILCDDPNRIMLDITRYRKGLRHLLRVLFNYKRRIVKGRKVYESREVCEVIK